MRALVRTPWLAIAAIFLALSMLVAGAAVNRGQAQTLNDGTKLEASRFQQPISLRDRLIVGLKAMSKSDLEFVDRVVAKVNSGQLPQRMVDETFFWARKRVAPTSRGVKERRPIIYFRPVLTAQARRIGVEL
jgi:hypothetical protein